MLLASSCIVADPPEYQDPVQTRPVLDVYKADPTTSLVLVVYTNDQVPISVPVRSEDAGVDLSAHFFIDYQGGSTPNASFQTLTIPASTYSDEGRAVTLLWGVHVASGCHLLTLLVAHRSSFTNANNDVLITEKAATDAAIINWWLNVNPAADATSTLVDCPLVGNPTITGVPTK